MDAIDAAFDNSANGPLDDDAAFEDPTCIDDDAAFDPKC